MDTIQATNYTPLKTEPKTIENGTIIKENVKTIIEPNQNQAIEINKINVGKPKVYKQFLKLIKRKKGLTAIAYAEILGITRQTISKWLDTPQARNTISDNIEYHYNVISDNKDWKAHAYMIDRATGKQDNTTNIQVNTLDGLTIIRR
jgi:DNA-binding transcriptional regulator YiaG